MTRFRKGATATLEGGSPGQGFSFVISVFVGIMNDRQENHQTKGKNGQSDIDIMDPSYKAPKQINQDDSQYLGRLGHFHQQGYPLERLRSDKVFCILTL